MPLSPPIFEYHLILGQHKSSVFKVHVSMRAVGWGWRWGQGFYRSASYCCCFHRVETRGRRSHYPHHDMKREKQCISQPLFLLHTRTFPTGAAGSLSPGSQRVTGFWGWKDRGLSYCFPKVSVYVGHTPKLSMGKQLLLCYRNTEILKLFI